ncbi:hypothetical protein MRB53_019872 [Persea americana]|uniref:Uncharacterized protein n=1 Tax=Persea americana TaxID=3435 RepID=A0ACC2KZF5_PERAE|nr:hypothetical protein MRB53_019872 [Persea americana]
MVLTIDRKEFIRDYIQLTFVLQQVNYSGCLSMICCCTVGNQQRLKVGVTQDLEICANLFLLISSFCYLWRLPCAFPEDEIRVRSFFLLMASSK